jgi:hypothetical protein
MSKQLFFEMLQARIPKEGPGEEHRDTLESLDLTILALSHGTESGSTVGDEVTRIVRRAGRVIRRVEWLSSGAENVLCSGLRVS